MYLRDGLVRISNKRSFNAIMTRYILHNELITVYKPVVCLSGCLDLDQGLHINLLSLTTK